jgi:hypothetical protein
VPGCGRQEKTNRGEREKHVHAPTPRQAPRRHAPPSTALFTLLTLVGLLATACGGSAEPRSAPGPESQDVHLQPVGAPGPDPFTPSSATGESAPAQPPLPNRTGQGIRTVGAATPGLYGGTERLGSCDVEAQIRSLTGGPDDARGKGKDEAAARVRAFTEASGVEEAKIPEFLRGLTPVVLRADTRVTSHGLVDGRLSTFQAVLQAGTAVLVDDHGMPRVRCACGNPLQAPRSAKGSPVHKGDAWNGYQPNQVIVIEPTIAPLSRLVIADVADNTWIERRTGDDGAQDRPPQSPPPYDPADGIPSGATPTTSTDPCAAPESNSLARTSPPPSGGTNTPVPGSTDCPSAPSSPDSRARRPGAAVPGNPDRPAAPQAPTAPADQPPADIAPAVPNEQPAQPLPPSDPSAGLPLDLPPDLPAEELPLQPGDPNADPFGAPYEDPLGAPEQPFPDPGLSLESA